MPYNNSFTVKEEVGRYCAYGIEFRRLTIPEFKVRDMGPGKLVIFDSLNPVFFRAIKGNTKYIKAFLVIIIPDLDNIRVLLAAGTTMQPRNQQAGVLCHRQVSNRVIQGCHQHH